MIQHGSNSTSDGGHRNQQKIIPLLFLVRHGESETSPDELLYGQHNVQLNPEGYKKLFVGGERLSLLLAKIFGSGKLHSFLSSDLTRCHHTSLIIREMIKQHLFLDLDIGLTRALREIHIGDLENRFLTEVRDAVLQFIYEYNISPDFAKPPGAKAESNWMIKRRILPILHSHALYKIEEQPQYYDPLLAELEKFIFFDHWVDEVIKLDIEFAVHIWVVHEGSAYAILNLLNADCWVQNVQEEFMEGKHQSFFTRGDILALHPIFATSELLEGAATIQGWRVCKIGTTL
jgi:broad specificity phosphatase PhoE